MGVPYSYSSGEHPFWIRSRGWVSAEKLLPGDEVFTSDGGCLRVISGTWLSQRQTVYNFEVEEFHTYFVGDSGVLVHNTCASRLSIKSLRGKNIKWLKKQKPKGWKTVPTRKNEGWIWVDENGNERLRFMRSNKKNPSQSQWGRQSNGYFRWQNERGDFLDIDGNIVSSSDPLFNEKTHIIYDGL